MFSFCLLTVLCAVSLANAFHEDCPCTFDPWLNVSQLAVYNAVDDCIETKDGDCVPTTFGLSICGTHDLDLEVNGCVGELDDTSACNSEWCYVDPENCSLPSVRDLNFDVTEETLLFRSYETCGFLSDYTRNKMETALSGLHLRISYPGDSSMANIELGFNSCTNIIATSFHSFILLLMQVAALLSLQTP